MKRVLMREPVRAAGFTAVDLLVVVGLILVLGVAFVGCQRSRGECSGRVKCASNLRQIGQALLLYANDNRGSYPRTRFAGGPKVIPTWGTGAATTQPFSAEGPEPNDVTAAIFLLLRTQDITSEVFVCPNASADRWDFDGAANGAANWSNWNGAQGVREHLTYSFQDPYPDDAAISSGFHWDNELAADFAIAADLNPGNSGDPNPLTITSTSSSRDLKSGNSPNHDGDGQNVLYGDGHVEFQATPFCGVKYDNIYARRAGPPASGLASSDIRNSSYDAEDSVLLPTAK